MNINEIKEIIRLIDESSIEEFTYETEDAKVKLKKSNGINAANTFVQVPQQTQVVQPATNTTNGVQSDEELSKEEQQPQKAETVSYDHEIVSPMVGTFYAAPSPDSDPYVTTGSKVQPDTVVCIVEAMKLFNEIEAEVTGEIVEILVENGELVEYGQPLFRVKTN